MSRQLIPSGGNDRVYTPSYLTDTIINDLYPFIKQNDNILEPCAGVGEEGGHFLKSLEKYGLSFKFCEIDLGLDFFLFDEQVDWIITNPPYSIFTDFLEKSLQVSENIVFLCSVNALFFKSRTRLLKKYGYGIRSIKYVETPPKPWPQSGIQLGVIHLQKDWKGMTIISDLC